MALVKKSKHKSSAKRKRNPIERVTLIRIKDKLVDARGNIFEVVKILNKSQVYAMNTKTRDLKVIDIKDVDFYDSKNIKLPITLSPIAELMAQHASTYTPVYVEFWNWVYSDRNRPNTKFEIMIDRKLNSERKPVSNYHYGIDLVNTIGPMKRLDYFYSEKIDGFTGYNDLETAIRGFRAMMKSKFNVNLPTDIKLTEHRIVSYK